MAKAVMERFMIAHEGRELRTDGIGRFASGGVAGQLIWRKNRVFFEPCLGHVG